MNTIIKLFQRSTNSKYFIPEIDGLRFFSIITVMLFHLNTAYSREIGIGLEGWSQQVGVDHPYQFGWWLIRMDLGVKVFFAISGFILGLPFLRHLFFGGSGIPLKEYFLRRLTRLEPPFIITLIGFYIVQVLMMGESFHALLPNFFTGLVYAHVFVFGVPNPINPVTWSLETEAQFYIVLPLIFYILSLISRKRLIFIFFLLLTVGSAYFRGYTLDFGLTHLSSSIFAYFINFAVGIGFAYLYLAKPSFFAKSKKMQFDLLGIGGIIGIFVFYKPQALLSNNLLFNAAVFLFFIATFRGQIFNWIFTRPLVYLIGGMCYSLYLVHYAFFYFIVRFTSSLHLGEGYWVDYALQVVLAFPLAIGFASVFFLLIEKPCMDKNWPANLKRFVQSKIGV